MVIQNTNFAGFTFKKHLEVSYAQQIQSFLNEIETNREQKKLNRHCSENKYQQENKEKLIPDTRPFRQKSEENSHGDIETEDHINKELKKLPLVSSLLKNKTNSFFAKGSGVSGITGKLDEQTKKLLVSSTTKLKKPGEKEPPKAAGIKRTNSPKVGVSKINTTAQTSIQSITSKISKNYAQPFLKDKVSATGASTNPPHSAASGQHSQLSSLVSCNSNVKKIISQIKSGTPVTGGLASAKPRTGTATKDTLLSTKARITTGQDAPKADLLLKGLKPKV